MDCENFIIKEINGVDECVPTCPPDKNKIVNEKYCESNCNGLNSYKFDQIGETKFFKCVETCPPEYPYLSIEEKMCYHICNQSYIQDLNNL